MEQICKVSMAQEWLYSSKRKLNFLSFVRSSVALLFRLLLIVPVFCFPGAMLRACGQTPSLSSLIATDVESALPDAPSAMPAPQQTTPVNIPLLPIVNNRPLQSMGIGDKFKYIVEPNFGPRSLLMNTFNAGIRMTNVPDHYSHEWHSGPGAYGRLYGDSFGRTGAQSIARFATSALLREDPRYHRSHSTFVPARVGHAIMFTFIDRTDGGRPTLALSNFTGAAAGGFIGNAYLPAGFDDLTHAGQRSTVFLGGVAMQNVATEFAPEIGHLLMKVHLHIPHVPLPPVWWTGSK